jgi:Domain of unknown function (DUF4340)
MNPLRPLAFHVAALVVGGISAAFAFSREKNPMQAYETGAVIWPGRPSDLQKVVFENANRRLTLEAKKDGGERWFLGTVQPLPATAPAAASKPFPAVATMTKLTESLAPLHATRSFGKLENSRYAELGLDKKDTSLTVTIGGTEHKLLVGAPSPGATDRYVLDEPMGNVYAVKVEPFQDLEAGDNRLAEHDQHDFRELDTASAKIISRDRTRNVVSAGTEGKKFWADAADREKADETVVNFMQKVDRLRATEYADKLPENAKLVARIEYTGNAKQKGFFELVKSPAKEGDKFDYWMTTEYLHLYGKLLPNMAEQVEQDIDSIVKQ